MKIGLLDCHNSDYASVAAITRPMKSEYCKKHDYDLLYWNFEDIGRFPTWGKVLGLKEYVPKYDWILFIDTDCLIMNQEIKIEDQVDENHDILVGVMPDFETGEPTHVSTSALLVRNSKWVINFIERWWDMTEFLDKPYSGPVWGASRGHGGKHHEQSAFQAMYDRFDDVRQQVKIMPFCWFNHRESNYQDGAFLIHFARQENKIKRIKQFLYCKSFL